jgi:hypothetical protein
MKGFLACALAATAAYCGAVDVGTFDNTRLYAPDYNLITGASFTMLKADWDARGAVWHQAGLLTPTFLAGVQVFITSMINATSMTADEQTALVNWVKAGGTLVATGECS